MTLKDTADLMEIIASAEDRQFNRDDVKNWHLIIGDLSRDKAEQALIRHLKQSIPGRTRPGHIVAMAEQIRRSDPEHAWKFGAA